MLIKSRPKNVSNTTLKSCEDFFQELLKAGYDARIRWKEIYKNLREHRIFIDFAESNRVLCKQLRLYYDGNKGDKLQCNNSYVMRRIDSQIKTDPIKYDGPVEGTQNNLLEYLSNLLLYKAVLLDIMEQFKFDLDNPKHQGLKELCEKLDYKLSIHIRFTRSMCALNAYTNENFTPEILKKYYTPYHETGAQDMFCRMIIKKANLMELARGEINRYVTCRPGVIATSPDPELYTTAKFRGVETKYFTGDVIAELTKFCKVGPKYPLWNPRDAMNDPTYSIEKRVQESCEAFNRLIKDKVISTFANYYRMNNVLDIKDERLYLAYKCKNNELSVPLNELKPEETKEAPLHIPVEYSSMPTSINNVTYKKIQVLRRNGPKDIYGLLYGIRKGKIAVSDPLGGSAFHSAIWSGKAVKATGILCAWNGKIIAVDNMSGHYQPNWYLLYLAWKPFYQKGIFHKDAMIGILVPNKMESQFLKAETFMKLAERNFPVGETLQALKRHKEKMANINPFDVKHQPDKKDCENVIQSYPLVVYHYIWKDEVSRDSLAKEFIKMMDYDNNEFSGRFNVSCNREHINNLMKERSEIVNKLIKKQSWFIFSPDRIKSWWKRKRHEKSLQKAVKNYLALKKKTIQFDELALPITEKCIPDIESAHKAYCVFTETLPHYDEMSTDIKKIESDFDSWIENIRRAVNVEANKKAGFDPNDYDTIFLDSGEQKVKAEEYIKDKNIFPEEFWKDISIDDLSNSSGKEKTKVKDELRLVDKTIYE